MNYSDININSKDGNEKENDEENFELSTETIIILVAIVFYFLFTFALVFILMSMQRRKNLWTNCCKGYFALVEPVNLLETRNKRKVFICAFALITLEVLESMDFNTTITKGASTYVKFFGRLGFMTVSALTFLPLLASIHLETIASYVIGLSYMIVYGSMTIFFFFYDSLGYKRGLDEVLDDFLLRVIVCSTCGVYLFYWFIKRIMKTVKHKSAATKSGISKHHIKYVKRLLAHGDRYNINKLESEVTIVDTGKLSKLRRLFRQHVYYNIPGFRYSLTILVAFTCALVMLTKFLISALATTAVVYNEIHDTFKIQQEWKNISMPNIFQYVVRVVFKPRDGTTAETNDIEDSITFFQFMKSQLVIVTVSVGMGCLIAFAGNIVGLCHMLMAYRSNVMNLYRSKREDILDVTEVGNVKIVICATQFAGYQVAYMMWGFIIQATFFTFGCLTFGELIILPMQFAFWFFLEQMFHFIMPVIIVLVTTNVIQYLLVRFVFLENQGKILAIDNRKGFSIMMYIMFFYTIFSGIFSCLLRIFKCIVLGVFLVSRLDLSVFPRAFESKDAGFKIYTCLLHLEALQCNPVLVCFIDILIKIHPSPKRMPPIPITDDETIIPNGVGLSKSTHPQLARNRWFVAVTLIHNPTLIAQRGIAPYSYLFENQMVIENNQIKT